MATSPTTRSLKKLREDGWRAAVVEHWNPFAHIRQDLFGVIDIVGVGERGTIGVQTTSDSNVSSRVQKIAESDAIVDLRKAKWIIEVHGWKKVGARWVCRVIDVS